MAVCKSWMFVHANTTHLCAQEATVTHSPSPTHSHLCLGVTLWTVGYWSWPLWNEQHKLNSRWLRMHYCTTYHKKLAKKHLAKAAGFTAPQKTDAVLCRDSSAAYCCPWETGCPPATSTSTALFITVLPWPSLTWAPYLEKWQLRNQKAKANNR